MIENIKTSMICIVNCCTFSSRNERIKEIKDENDHSPKLKSENILHLVNTVQKPSIY
jgi:hypothetical protein